MRRQRFDVEVLLHTREGLKSLRKFSHSEEVFATRGLRELRTGKYKLCGVSVIGSTQPAIHVYLEERL